MNGILRNFPVIKVICHIILIAIWIYWGTCIHPLTTGWIEWIILVGGGIIYFFLGGICIILDDESDINDAPSVWGGRFCLTNILLLGIMMYYTGLYPNALSLLICPTIFIATTLLLCGFNGVVSAFLLVFISVSLWLSNWGLNRWYDYCILIGTLIIAYFSILITCFKYVEDDEKSSILVWFINFGLCSLVNVGLLSLLYFNELLDVNNLYNILYLTAGAFLFSLVVSTRLFTLLLVAIAGSIYLWRNTEFTLSSLIPELSFEWIYHDWFKWSIAASLGLLLIILIIRYYNRKLENQEQAYMERSNRLEGIIRKKEEIIRQLKQAECLPIEYNGLTMTCPHCRKTMVRGKYAESTARGVAKTTAKGLIRTGSVGTFFSIGFMLGGPVGALGGAAIGGVITFFANKPIDKGVESVMDVWNYEVDGGRNVYFKCPRHECGHEWTMTETYGVIDH